MIICCEECETRFRLDEARIPERGARVRCSRCNHSFVVRPPSGDASDDAIAREAAAAAASAVESGADVSADSVGDATTQEAAADSESPDSALEDDDDWEFGPSEADVPGNAKAEPSPPEPALDPETASDEAPIHADAAAVSSDVEAEADEAFSNLLDSEEAPGGSSPVESSAVDATDDTPTSSEGPTGSVASGVDHEDPFAESGADLSGTGNLDVDDRDFEEAAALAEGESNDAAGDSMASLGDPSNWDLLDEDDALESPPPAPPATPEREPGAPSAGVAETSSAPPRPSSDALFPPTDLFSGGPDDADDGSFGVGTPDAADDIGEAPPAWAAVTQRAASFAAWPVVLMLAVVALSRFLVLEEQAPTAQAISLERGFEIYALESEVIENAYGGPVLIVSGALRNAGPQAVALESAVAVTLLGTEGQRFDEARVLMGPTPTRDALRETDPAYLQSHGDYAARQTAYDAFRPGEERLVAAVFDHLPGGATRFSVGLQQVPAQVRRPVHVGPPAPAQGQDAPESAGEAQDASGAEAGVEASGGNVDPFETATAFPSEALPSRE